MEENGRRYELLKDWLLKNGYITHHAVTTQDSEPFVMGTDFLWGYIRGCGRLATVIRMTIGLLFSYGSLQSRAVQVVTFGRELACHEDTLPGYVHRWTIAADPEIAAMTGIARYATVEPSSNPSDAVSGTALEITEQDLTAADKYEEDKDYRRIIVTLGSGSQAWLYVRAG